MSDLVHSDAVGVSVPTEQADRQVLASNTPGPWFADRDGQIWRRHPSELYENGGGVAGDRPIAQASVGNFRWENKYPLEANARLIAAAPDLLEAARAGVEALEQYVHALHHMPSEQLEAHPYIPTVEDAFDALRAAISRASGESQ